MERTIKSVLIGWKERWSNVWRGAIKLAAEDSWEPEGWKKNLRNSRENCNKDKMRERKYVISTKK